jgi:hypothetical protein
MVELRETGRWVKVAASYLELRPRTELRSYVACTWVSALEEVPEGHRGVLPDGCVDIICAVGREPFVAGPDTESRLVGTAAEMLIGVRFLPGWLPLCSACRFLKSQIRRFRSHAFGGRERCVRCAVASEKRARRARWASVWRNTSRFGSDRARNRIRLFEARLTQSCAPL